MTLFRWTLFPTDFAAALPQEAALSNNFLKSDKYSTQKMLPFHVFFVKFGFLYDSQFGSLQVSFFLKGAIFFSMLF